MPVSDTFLEVLEYRNVTKAAIDPATANPGTAHFCLYVTDLDPLYERLVDAGVRLQVIGRRDRLPEGLAQEIATAEAASALGARLALNVAIDYSARDAIANAAAGWLGDDSASRTAFGRLLAWQGHGTGRDVDLLIRTGGEKRLSDFLLWESAYAELCFVDTCWPDFGPEHLRAAISNFHTRERRFGGLHGAFPGEVGTGSPQEMRPASIVAAE